MARAWVLVALLSMTLSGCVSDDGIAPDRTATTGLVCPDPCKVGIDTSAATAWEPHVAADPLDPDHIVVVSRV